MAHLPTFQNFILGRFAVRLDIADPVKLTQNDLRCFQTTWDEVLASMRETPKRDLLEPWYRTQLDQCATFRDLLMKYDFPAQHTPFKTHDGLNKTGDQYLEIRRIPEFTAAERERGELQGRLRRQWKTQARHGSHAQFFDAARGEHSLAHSTLGADGLRKLGLRPSDALRRTACEVFDDGTCDPSSKSVGWGNRVVEFISWGEASRRGVRLAADAAATT